MNNYSITLRNLLPKEKPVLFFCIGTDRSTGDSLGPLVGKKLSEKGLPVFGTIDDPVHAANIADTIEIVKQDYPDHTIVAIDAALGRDIGAIKIKPGPVKPGAGVHKQLPEVGDVHIIGVVNIAGFMEYFVLQNTRLALVMKMADEIAASCMEALKTGEGEQDDGSLRLTTVV
ncbi:spore protease YyaC [Brevibacillus migulae]|uniref:spore protease YyaC n=1 Tax=Brevibacillus migulae TaxID=1644114 RepID=UPI00106F0947|nr:spore protease YyaC [Brevibacillus migulae]